MWTVLESSSGMSFKFAEIYHGSPERFRANRAQYTNVSFQGITEGDVQNLSLPSTQGTAEDNGGCFFVSPWGDHLLLHPALEALSSLSVQDASSDVFSTPPQLDGELITLTLLPRSRWQTLLNLEVIQQRNKPKEPPKPIEKAPFFLPTLPGVETRFTYAEKKPKETKKSTHRLDKTVVDTESVCIKKMMEEELEGDCKCWFSRYLLQLFNIRS